MTGPGRRDRREGAPVRATAAALLCAMAAVAALPAAAHAQGDPQPRTSLLPLAQPLWSDLTAAQRSVLEPFGSQWNALPMSEKRAWVELANRFPQMGAEEQRRVRRRIVQWAGLTPEQRELARANYRLAKDLPRDSRVAEWESYRAMTPEQRAVLGSEGRTSNTAAGHAGAPTGLAKEAAQPLPRRSARGAVAPAPAAPALPTADPAAAEPAAEAAPAAPAAEQSPSVPATEQSPAAPAAEQSSSVPAAEAVPVPVDTAPTAPEPDAAEAESAAAATGVTAPERPADGAGDRATHQ
jgi:hypothetical protein